MRHIMYCSKYIYMNTSCKCFDENGISTNLSQRRFETAYLLDSLQSEYMYSARIDFSGSTCTCRHMQTCSTMHLHLNMYFTACVMSRADLKLVLVGSGFSHWSSSEQLGFLYMYDLRSLSAIWY